MSADTGGENISAADRGGSLHKVSSPVYSLSSSLLPPSFGGTPDFADTSCESHNISDFKNEARGSVSSLTYVSGDHI